MASDLELIGPGDKPALLGLSTADALAVCKGALADLGYKVHTARNHDEFLARFDRLQYQVVILEEAFSSASPAENRSLQTLQNMAMAHRRHATVLLVGDACRTLDAMQAFQKSVHAVVARQDLANFPQILRQVIADNDLFLSMYREVQLRLAQGKL